MPFAPDFGRGKHAAGATHVAESSLTGSVSSSSRHAGDTSNSTSCRLSILAVRLLYFPSLYHCSPYLYPMIRRMFGVQLSRSLHMAAFCSLPFQNERSCNPISCCTDQKRTLNADAYWTMSGRIGDLKTAGRGCVDPLGVPSAPAMVTVGRVVMSALRTSIFYRCPQWK